VLLKPVTNGMIAPRSFLGHGMPCPYCRKKEKGKRAGRMPALQGNDVAMCAK